MEITLVDGATVVEEIAVADAHPRGARPFARAQYVEKFRTLADGVLPEEEIERFLSVAQRLPDLGPDELGDLTVVAPADLLASVTTPGGIF
jgi:2-methylcitrate dehydratase